VIEADAEEKALRQRRLSVGQPQGIDGWQEQFGHLLPAGIDAFQIASEHIKRIAQRRQLSVPLLAGTDRDVGRQLQNLLRKQLAAGQLDELERTAYLLQVLDSLL